MHLDPNDSRAEWHASPEAQRERLSAWLDGALPAEERAALDAHLATCAACQRELAGLRQVRALLRALPDPTPPRPFLLPLEGELAIPTPPTPSTSYVARPAGMRVAPRRWPRYAQRFGGLAAALGLALLGTSALLGGHHGANSAATTAMGSYAPAVGAGASTATADARIPTGNQNQDATASPASGTAGGPAPTPARRAADGAPEASEAAPPFVPIAGGGLLAGGLILLVGGSLADRRGPGHMAD